MLYNALIRTHHVTSRKKLAVLAKAASKLSCNVLVKYGGPPGIMYCEGSESGVREWVATVQRLRYKDYLLVCRPAETPPPASLTKSSGGVLPASRLLGSGLHEVETVKQFAASMDALGLLAWWRLGMGYSSPP